MKKLNKDQEIYFHLGLPKTASTFLQVITFPKLEGIKYFRKRKFKDFVQLAQASKSKKLLFTTESDRGFNQKLIKITQHFPDARIMLVFRRHDQWIISKYKYYVRKHGHLTFGTFFNLENDSGYWKKKELYFEQYVDQVKSQTLHPPLVLTYDELKHAPSVFIEKLCVYLGVAPPKNFRNTKIKKAFSNRQVYWLRKFNATYRYKELNTSSPLVNKVHYKYREFLLHTVAFMINLIPRWILPDAGLTDSKTLEEIRIFYQDDWKKIQHYSKVTPSKSEDS